MIPYLLVFVIALAYYLSSQGNRQSSGALLCFFAYLAIFIGLGDMIGGYDRYIYGEVFDTIADEIRSDDPDVGRILYLVQGSEYGYFYWNIFVSLFTKNRYIFILVTTLTCYALYYRAFKNYMEDYPLACILFLGLFYYFTMTYLRQVMAVGIAWQGLKYIWEKDYRFFLYVIVGYLFHSSALIFAPVFFVPLKQYPKSVITSLLFVCLLIGLTPLPSSLLSDATESMGKGSYEAQDQGFRIEYVLEAVFFVWIFFKNYKRIDDDDPKKLAFLNMSFVFCGMLLVFMRFGQGGRLGWYYMFGLIYTLTHLANMPRAYTWMKPFVIAVSAALFLRITIAWMPLNVPYKTFLTNGQPAGDGSTYSLYEYDEGYQRDKFYR